MELANVFNLKFLASLGPIECWLPVSHCFKTLMAMLFFGSFLVAQASRSHHLRTVSHRARSLTLTRSLARRRAAALCETRTQRASLCAHPTQAVLQS